MKNVNETATEILETIGDYRRKDDWGKNGTYVFPIRFNNFRNCSRYKLKITGFLFSFLEMNVPNTNNMQKNKCCEYGSIKTMKFPNPHSYVRCSGGPRTRNQGVQNCVECKNRNTSANLKF